MRNEPSYWGCPNWKNADEYGDTTSWLDEHWVWEFRRRRQPIRFTFSDLAIKEFRKREKPVPDDYLHLPEFRRKFFLLSPSTAATFGYSHLPNPAYADSLSLMKEEIGTPDADLKSRTLLQWHVIAPKLGRASEENIIGTGQIAIVFDPSRPVEPQIDGLQEYIESFRHHSIEHPRKTHRSKWLRYLRILDARESGASYSEIAEALLGATTAATKQTARDNFRQAVFTRDGV